jgi:hypothetical protein
MLGSGGSWIGGAGGKYIETNRFEIIGSGTSGTVSLPTNSTVMLDRFGGTVDAVTSEVSSSTPTYVSAKTAGGVPIAATFNSSGNWSLSGTPSSYPIAIIYRVKQMLANFDSEATNIVGDLFLQANTSLGYTAENVANKDTDTNFSANSDTRYPSQKATKTYMNNIYAALDTIKENTANKATDFSVVDNVKFPTTEAANNNAIAVALVFG